ncbi:hypothetical protein BD779DRAFT_1483141 [Infundibulicybe gibba]|nr:hypothetical protein BD779DRAFT_1483141 [Infundibulicybe gibba]
MRSSTFETLLSITCAGSGKAKGKRKAFGAGDEDEDGDESSDDDGGESSDDDDDDEDEIITKTCQPPRSVGHSQRSVKRPRTDYQLDAEAKEASVPPAVDLAAKIKRRETLSDSIPELKQSSCAETASINEHAQLFGKGKHAEGINSLRATHGREVPDGSVGEGSGSTKADNVETQKPGLAPCLTEGPSQLAPKNTGALDQIMRDERSLAEMVAELSLARDAISRHHAQIRLSSMQLSHLEILEKELCAAMDKRLKGY